MKREEEGGRERKGRDRGRESGRGGRGERKSNVETPHYFVDDPVMLCDLLYGRSFPT